ncbi:Mpo1 family 2-hydroxy fatty acid dioxygenase [Alginatibacterium sediminis]|nr:Mpo1-like protein [Alginatibacterium sediminis]
MRSLQSWLDEYAQSHQNPQNKRIHFIAVPSIYFTVVGLLWSIPTPTWLAELGFVNGLSLLVVPIMLFYFTLSLRLGLLMSLFTGACVALLYAYQALGLSSVTAMCIAVFVVMWIAQFYGHKLEGKKPSFFKDVFFLLIGPAWIIHNISTR